METGYVASALTEKIRGSYRAQAGFLHPLVLAEYLILTIPIAISFVKIKVSKHIKLASVTVLTLGVYTLISTGSRAGVLIFILQLGLMFLFKLIRDLKNQREIMPIIRSFVMIAVIFTGIPISYNFASLALEGQSNSESMSTQARIDQFNLGLDTFEKHPLVGWGPGLAVDHVASSNVTTGEKSVDNYYLTVAADSGLPAFILFFCLVVTYYRKARKLMAKLESPYSNISDGLSFSLFGFFIFCAVLSTFEVFTLAYVYFALLTKLEVFQKDKRL
jgi:O-antigen ligase